MATDSRWARVVREPLVLFFSVALVLFAANHLINGPERRPSSSSLTISQGRVRQIAESYRLFAPKAATPKTAGKTRKGAS